MTTRHLAVHGVVPALFFSLLLAGECSLTACCEQQPPADERDRAIASFKKVCDECGAAIDVYHVDDYGVAVVISAKTDESVKRIHAAADDYASVVKKTAKARKAEGVRESVNPTTAGVLIHVFSSEPAAIKSIQAVECCKWCVCPARTNACVKICPHCRKTEQSNRQP